MVDLEGGVCVETVGEVVANAWVNAGDVVAGKCGETILDSEEQNRVGKQRTANRTHGLTRSLAALRTARPKFEENPVSPPHPEMSSSSSPGSREEMSFETTLPSPSNVNT